MAMDDIVLAQTVYAEMAANKFVELDRDDLGGHYFSQVIYAPTIEGVVSWGTRTQTNSRS